MRRIFLGAIALIAAAGCTSSGPKVMARYVPERLDDFVWENNLVCYRAYGEALEGDPTSPGFDVWVKLPGSLVADAWYKGALEESNYYHKDHGGKDCYKVGVSLGGGASSPLVDGKLIYPATNYRSWEILSKTGDEITFVLNYPAWDVNGTEVSLSKKITVCADSYFCKAEDVYTGDFDSLTVAAGIFMHEVEDTHTGSNRIAVWEHASDQSVEPEDGMIGVAVYMPGAESILPLEIDNPHLVAAKTISSGEPLVYWFGSCWSKGDIKDSDEWFGMVDSLAL